MSYPAPTSALHAPLPSFGRVPTCWLKPWHACPPPLAPAGPRSCVSGCHCHPKYVDGHHEEHNSQTFLAQLDVSQAGECVLGIRLLTNTSSGEHKFKVGGRVWWGEGLQGWVGGWVWGGGGGGQFQGPHRWPCPAAVG